MGKKAPSRQLQVRGIVSFPQIFQPQMKERTDEKTKEKRTEAIYSLDLLLPENSPDVDALRDLAMEVAVAEWGPDTTKWPKPKYDPVELAGMKAMYGEDQSKWPLFKYRSIRDQGEKEIDQNGNKRAGYVPGRFFISPSSKYRPPVVDFPDCNEIVDPSVFYAGCECLVQVNGYTYAYMGNVGVKFGLVAVQKVGPGTPFGNGKPDVTKIFNKPATGATPAGSSAKNLL